MVGRPVWFDEDGIHVIGTHDTELARTLVPESRDAETESETWLLRSEPTKWWATLVESADEPYYRKASARASNAEPLCTWWY